MKTKNLFAALLLACAPAVGCVSYVNQSPMPVNLHEVVLRENDFTAQRSDLSSSHECWYLFGVIPLGNPNVLSLCMTDLRDGAQLNGNASQFVNYTKDDTRTHFLIVMRHKLTLTADTITFTK